MKDTKQFLLALGGLLILLAVIVAVSYFASRSNIPADTSVTTISEQESPVESIGATSTQETASSQPSISPIANITTVGDYAYIQAGKAYFRSVTGKEDLPIPNSDAATFRSIVDFVTYPSSSTIVAECGGVGGYGVYADINVAYFYQVWRTPLFTASKIEAVPISSPNSFAALGNGSFTDGSTIFNVNYYITDTRTCRFTLDKA